MVVKKILTLFLILQFVFYPAVLAQEPVILNYDFSEEAQQQFDRQKYNPVIPVTEIKKDDFSRQKSKKTIKTGEDEVEMTPVFTPAQSNYYLPAYDTANPNALKGTIVSVPAGTPLNITFDSGISSGSIDKNDRIVAVLSRDWMHRGLLLAPAGSLVYGSITDASSAGYAYGSGSMELEFYQILPEHGNPINISTEKIYLQAESNRAKGMTKDVVIGTAVGVLLGLLFGAVGGGDDIGKSMLIYGSMGAAGGTIKGVTQRGTDVHIPDGTSIEVKLSNPIQVSPYI